MNNLSKTEQYLLCIYTLFHVEGSQTGRVRSMVKSLTGQPLIDFKMELAAIKTKGYFEERGYNWRNDTYDYRVSADKLIPLMLFFYEQEPELTIRVLDEARELKPSNVQKMLWQFISSAFENIRIEEISDYDIGESLDCFVPAVLDNRFMPLLMVFSAPNFHDLIERTLLKAFEDEEMIDMAYLRSLIRRYRFDSTQTEHALHELLCMCDLLEYFMTGKSPLNINTANRYHLMLAAIYEAYHGNFSKSLYHFKNAVSLGNKSGSFYSSTKNYLPISIANFFYIITAYRTGTDEGRKRALAVDKAPEGRVTAAGKLLYEILYRSTTEKQLFCRLNQLYEAGGVNSSLATLMCHYVGKEFSNETPPRWDIIRHEAGTPSSSSTPPLLSSIYRHQTAQSVVSEIMGTKRVGIDLVANPSKGVRIGYFMRNITDNEVTPRQQATLKNGGWGAGRQVSLPTFITGQIEGTSESDMRIIEKGLSLRSVLPEMVQESRLYVGRYAPFTPVEVVEEMPYITLHHDSEGFHVGSNVTATEVDSDIIITYRGAASINFMRLTPRQRPYYRRLLAIGSFPNEAEPLLRRFLKSMGKEIEVHSDLIEGGSTLPICDGSPQLIMQMRPDRSVRGGEQLYRVSFFVRPLPGGKIRQTPGEGNEVVIDNGLTNANEIIRTRVRRNLAAERENVVHIVNAFSEEVPEIQALIAGRDNLISSFALLPLIEYAQANPDHITCEWPEGARMRIKRHQSAYTWNGVITRNDNGWFEIEGSVHLDQDKVITMSQLLELASQSEGRYITLGGGDFLAISEQLRRQLDTLSALASRHHGKLQMSPFSAALLGPDILDGELKLDVDEQLTEIRRRIKEASTYTPAVPANLHATLRQYQTEGYQWISRLNYWGAGALLADDMGLGKTIQTIAFLLSKAEEGPALVIAPASVAPNWKVEFEKFAPSLRITMLNFESDRAEAILRAEAGDVVVCTYMLLLSVKEEITHKQWNTICLDEAHIIKNRGAKTSAVAMKLQSKNRIMLTGTPVQNHLGELWNLFQFVNPGLLGTFEDFNRRFIQPIEQHSNHAVQSRLDRLVKPFMLRRTKDKVARELPEKEEIYQHVTMSEEEQLSYEAMRQKAEALLLANGPGTLSMNTLAEITRLRLAACCQSKVTALLELLQTVTDGYDQLPVDKRGGALVFSQFTTYLDDIRHALDDAHIPYLYIDGSVPIKRRQLLVEQYQAGECPVFLISLKAGGLGLNLTRANYVIHMDPWWNPAIESQATDRTHRIGQQRAVTVYHLISEGTIEEKIQRLHERKQALVTNILAATDMSHKLTGEELLEMVRA